jgi:O-antigen/teichoic acid export membrane protein
MENTSTSSSIRRDGLWSLGSFAVIVVSGLLINIVVANSLGRSAHGMYNTCLSIVLIGGQLATMGMHSAMAFFIPVAIATEKNHHSYLRVAMKFVLLSSSSLIFVVVVTAELLMKSHISSDFLVGIRCSYLALFLFPFTKVLVSYANGLGNIKAAAIANGSRFLFMFSVALLMIRKDVSWTYLPVVISCAEFLVVAGLAIFTRSALQGFWHEDDEMRQIHRDVVTFGRRSIPASFLLDVNTRVDILVLSILKGADVVGQYTIASTFSEGLFQMCMVMRLAIEPRVAGLAAKQIPSELVGLIRKYIGMSYLLLVPVIACAMALYVPMTKRLFDETEIVGTSNIFYILAVGIIFSCGFIPLTNLLQQVGDPLGQSGLLLIVSFLNLIGNLILVPRFGGTGAAAGTAIAQIMFVPMLLLLINRRQQISLWKQTSKL